VENTSEIFKSADHVVDVGSDTRVGHEDGSEVIEDVRVIVDHGCSFLREVREEGGGRKEVEGGRRWREEGGGGRKEREEFESADRVVDVGSDTWVGHEEGSEVIEDVWVVVDHGCSFLGEGKGGRWRKEGGGGRKEGGGGRKAEEGRKEVEGKKREEFESANHAVDVGPEGEEGGERRREQRKEGGGRREEGGGRREEGGGRKDEGGGEAGGGRTEGYLSDVVILVLGGDADIKSDPIVVIK
jgi:hypothetical protein